MGNHKIVEQIATNPPTIDDKNDIIKNKEKVDPFGKYLPNKVLSGIQEYICPRNNVSNEFIYN